MLWLCVGFGSLLLGEIFGHIISRFCALLFWVTGLDLVLCSLGGLVVLSLLDEFLLCFFCVSRLWFWMLAQFENACVWALEVVCWVLVESCFVFWVLLV